MAECNCRVCGLTQPDPPWGEDGASPNYLICSCCGVEFGYEDSTVESTRTYRDTWLQQGSKWLEPGERPDDWSRERQLSQVPGKFR